MKKNWDVDLQNLIVSEKRIHSDIVKKVNATKALVLDEKKVEHMQEPIRDIISQKKTRKWPIAVVVVILIALFMGRGTLFASSPYDELDSESSQFDSEIALQPAFITLENNLDTYMLTLDQKEKFRQELTNDAIAVEKFAESRGGYTNQMKIGILEKTIIDKYIPRMKQMAIENEVKSGEEQKTAEVEKEIEPAKKIVSSRDIKLGDIYKSSGLSQASLTSGELNDLKNHQDPGRRCEICAIAYETKKSFIEMDGKYYIVVYAFDRNSRSNAISKAESYARATYSLLNGNKLIDETGKEIIFGDVVSGYSSLIDFGYFLKNKIHHQFAVYLFTNLAISEAKIN